MLNLADYHNKTHKAVKAFWNNREKAKTKQLAAGKADQGERTGVTAGKNMDGFRAIIGEIVKLNGLSGAEIQFERELLTLPGFFRPTKQWDVVVMNEGVLIAALEFKSQVAPSFGNNFNNRAEEAIGAAIDFWTAYREGAFGKDAQKPFLGWFLLLEETLKSTAGVKDHCVRFPIFPEFANASYSERYNLLCRKLIQEQLYSAASVILSSRSALKTGQFSEMSELTGINSFITNFAGHIASEAARTKRSKGKTREVIKR